MMLLRRCRVLASLLLLCSCRCKAASSAPVALPPARAAKDVPVAELKVTESIYERELKNGWMDYGWSDRSLNQGPAKVNLSDYGGWIIAKPGSRPAFGGLLFKVKAPAGPEGAYDVRLESDRGVKFPRVVPTSVHTVSSQDGWTKTFVSMAELNPEERPFDRIVLQGKTGKSVPAFFFEEIGLTWMDPALAAGGKKAKGPAVPVALTVDCKAKGTAISPLIFGIGLDFMESKEDLVWEMGATGRRWGGNPSSRYNWKLGTAWNTASDWYFENVNYTENNPGYSYDVFLEENLKHQAQGALTVPTLGWVAKDTSTFGFPVSRFGKQQSTDPWKQDAGNGKGSDGKPIPSGEPTLTSVPASPEFIAEWVKSIREKDKGRGKSVRMYILDNEPMLWHETHRDVHPQRTSYDELWERTVQYGTAIRKADPDAVIAGPAEWGWTSYFYSAVDTAGSVFLRPDRRKHADVPLLVWYLQKLAEHQKKTGVRLVDILDVHFYPQGKGMGLGNDAQTDPDTAALRLRSTRSLWDPTYKDESWIDDHVMLIPRLKKWIAENNPGMGVSLGEYNFGAETHMSGGLAQAEALGRFAQEGLTAAYFWDYPPKASPAYWAYRAYRNFDGKGGKFQDTFVPSKSATPWTSLFASRDATGKHYVLVALNLDTQNAAQSKVALEGCGDVASTRTFQYTGTPSGFSPLPNAEGLQATLPPYSLTVYDIVLK